MRPMQHTYIKRDTLILNGNKYYCYSVREQMFLATSLERLVDLNTMLTLNNKNYSIE